MRELWRLTLPFRARFSIRRRASAAARTYDAPMREERKRIVASGYDRIAARYLDWASATTDEARDLMLARFEEGLPDGARVLDLGCGAGVPSAQRLAERFQVVGVDISPAQVAAARRNVPSARFIEGDITEVDFAPGSFGGVVALYAISHVPREQHAGLFAAVFGWLAPGGRFLATLGAHDSPDWIGDWLGEPMFFSSHDADENRRLLRTAGFELVGDDVLVTHEPEGDVSFLWVLARKP